MIYDCGCPRRCCHCYIVCIVGIFLNIKMNLHDRVMQRQKKVLMAKKLMLSIFIPTVDVFTPCHKKVAVYSVYILSEPVERPPSVSAMFPDS